MSKATKLYLIRHNHRLLVHRNVTSICLCFNRMSNDVVPVRDSAMDDHYKRRCCRIKITLLQEILSTAASHFICNMVEKYNVVVLFVKLMNLLQLVASRPSMVNDSFDSKQALNRLYTDIDGAFEIYVGHHSRCRKIIVTTGFLF